MRRNSVVGCALLFVAFFTSALAQGLAGCEEYLKYGPPSNDSVLLCRSGYALSHDSVHKVARWVSYHLTRTHLERSVRRSNDFRPDPELKPGERSELADYLGSGYDRGHLAPAGSLCWNKQVMSESFLLSNMAPQVGVGFNRGIWKTLEADERAWAIKRGELYIITGPIYAGTAIKHIGKDNVAVPTHFYKIMFDPLRVEAIAFILPNQKNKSSKLQSFITSIDRVEEETGLDFLPGLDDRVEARVEEEVQGKMW